MGMSLTGAVILVVDDNEMNVELLANMLERSLFKPVTAMGGKEALTVLEETIPELILLDINMPEMSGYDVCRHLKADEKTSAIPVIFISALDELENIIEGFDVGGVDYITKPFRFREVLARVTNHLTAYRQKCQIEEMRARERQQFKKIDDLRKQFIGSATHDLKNPLFVISGNTEMLESVEAVRESEEAKHFIDAIQRGIGKMNTLVADILDLLQLETEVNLEKTSCSLTKFLVETAEDMRASAEKKGHKFIVYPPDEEVEVLIDPIRFARVLENLISNAIKYTPTPNGEIYVQAKVGFTTVEIEVIDTGLGIPEDVMPKLFNPFVRVNTEEHMAQDGTGLGLSIVKTLVEQHQGTVEVKSELGKGSTFRVILPINS